MKLVKLILLFCLIFAIVKAAEEETTQNTQEKKDQVDLDERPLNRLRGYMGSIRGRIQKWFNRRDRRILSSAEAKQLADRILSGFNYKKRGYDNNPSVPRGLRVTIIDATGNVLHDTRGTQTENHNSRPEVMNAIISRRSGSASRPTSTTDKDNFEYYLARFFQSNNRDSYHFVVRISIVRDLSYHNSYDHYEN